MKDNTKEILQKMEDKNSQEMREENKAAQEEASLEDLEEIKWSHKQRVMSSAIIIPQY